MPTTRKPATKKAAAAKQKKQGKTEDLQTVDLAAAEISEELPSQPEGPPANLKWTADPEKGEPPAFVKVGARRIDLPDAETQRTGFYSKDARLLARVVPGLKLIKEKGA